jgi:hypothetical protein
LFIVFPPAQAFDAAQFAFDEKNFLVVDTILFVDRRTRSSSFTAYSANALQMSFAGC